MHILIAGASGFIGRHLINHWSSKHQISVLGRNKATLHRLFPDKIACYHWDELEKINPHDLQVVINLCGYNIGKRRWSEAVKQLIIDSRVETTTSLINWLSHHQATPHFYCANAIGLYGLQDQPSDTTKDEETLVETNNPSDFLSQVSILWKQAAEKALEHDIPLTITCFGVVLGKGEGVLKKIAPSFKFGLGSIMGTGEQMLSWVHIDDIVKGYDFLIENPKITGIINLCSPNPVPQKTFAQTLAKAMKRPLLLKTPEFVIRMLFGEMGECLIIHGQRVIPKRLLALDFVFVYPTIEEALTAEFQPS
ncbi:TIGR01777 family oxidoreductase [Legionella sp. W05-934-2]|uniref:TIGR01777 family oxidoreductase n=1 Tax=Legionella sp. W05-934-2 TaxID=1198649 RepID=UPI003463028A